MAGCNQRAPVVGNYDPTRDSRSPNDDSVCHHPSRIRRHPRLSCCSAILWNTSLCRGRQSASFLCSTPRLKSVSPGMNSERVFGGRAWSHSIERNLSRGMTIQSSLFTFSPMRLLLPVPLRSLPSPRPVPGTYTTQRYWYGPTTREPRKRFCRPALPTAVRSLFADNLGSVCSVLLPSSAESDI